MSNKPLFELGQIVATPCALEALTSAGATAQTYLLRHVSGDWGELDAKDIQENVHGVKEGLRIFSAYELSTGVRIWVITEWDRSVTTILLPDEY